MKSISRNKKQQEKTGPKNKSVRELCKEANRQIVKNGAALAQALCDRVKKDGSPNAMAKLLELAERMKFGEDGEEEPEVEVESVHKLLLDQWESEPEWTGEENEATAEVAALNREQAAWQPELPAVPAEKEAAAQPETQHHTAQNHTAQTELGIHAVEPARQPANEPGPEGSRSATISPAGVVTPSGFVVYNGAASPASTVVKGVDQHR